MEGKADPFGRDAIDKFVPEEEIGKRRASLWAS
jgi:hypothetical protein